MISAPKVPQSEADVGNVQPEKISSNQRAVPLPYFAGRRWLKLNQAQSRVYNLRPAAVTQKVGKSSAVTGYDYYGDLFGLTSCCVVDHIEEIEVAGLVVWGGGISRDGGHVHHTGDIVVPGVGTFRFHWGTPDATADWLMLGTCGEDHPLYLDQSKLEVKNCYFGRNSTPPTIRVLVERAARFDGLDESRSQEGANAVTSIAEVIGSDWFGLARPDLIDLTTWAPFADSIKRETAMVKPGDPDYVATMGYISPYADRIQALQSYLGSVLEHFDGWLRRTGEKLEIGQFPHDGVVPDDLPELSFHDFIEAPTFDADDDSAGDVITDAIVTHLDRDNAMEEDFQPATNDAARARLGEIREKTFARPFIVTSYQAREQANELAKFFSREEQKCSVPIRRERIVGLRAGDRFILNDAPSGERIVVRIVQRRDDSDGGRVSLTLVAERGLAPLGYVPVPNPEPTLPLPDLEPIVNARMFQWPPFAEFGDVPTLAPLAERPASFVSGFAVHFSSADVTYDLMARSAPWALRGTLSANITAGAASLTLAAAGHDIAILASQSAAAAADDTLLLIVASEIMAVGAVVALGGGSYTVDVLRGRRGSLAAAHVATDVCYVIARADLTILQHADFPVAGGNRYFKLPTFDLPREQALADALKITLNLAAMSVGAPGGLSVTAYPGYNAIKWTASATATVSEYGIYRNTVNNAGTATKIAENDGTFFNDSTAVPGTAYWYYIEPITASEVLGARTLAGTVTTSVAPVPNTTPSNPSPASKTADGTYVSDDFTAFAYITLSIPGLPAGAVWQNVLCRRNISAEFEIAAQLDNTGTVTLRLDDRTPGVVYQVATQAWAPGHASGIVAATGAPFTAPSPPTPNPPTGLTLSVAANDLAHAPPRFLPAAFGGTKMNCARASWTASTSGDVVFYEVENVAMNVTPSPYDDQSVRTKGNETEIFLYSTWGGGSPTATTKVRAVNRAGGRSAYVTTVDNTPSASYGTGNMAEQAKTDVTVSGIKTGNTSASSVRQVKARYAISTTPSLAGGATSENVNISLSNRGFSTAPDVCIGNGTVTGDNSVTWFYDKAASTSTTAVITLYTLNGFNLPAGANYRLDLEFVEYV